MTGLPRQPKNSVWNWYSPLEGVALPTAPNGGHNDVNSNNADDASGTWQTVMSKKSKGNTKKTNVATPKPMQQTAANINLKVNGNGGKASMAAFIIYDVGVREVSATLQQSLPSGEFIIKIIRKGVISVKVRGLDNYNSAKSLFLGAGYKFHTHTTQTSTTILISNRGTPR